MEFDSTLAGIFRVHGEMLRELASGEFERELRASLLTADGVGLLRIEQLYFARPMPPTEDELFWELESLVAPLETRPVTIRLLDIGGDKPLPYLALPPTSNPGLGRRGVRLLLDYSPLVRTQMGAILRLAAEHSLRVLIPMVTIEDDIRRMREAFDALRSERKVSSPAEFGAMVETPAAALAIPALVKHVRLLLRRHERPHPIHLGRSRRRLGQRLLSGRPRVGDAIVEHRRKRGRWSARHALRGIGWARSLRAPLAKNGISWAERCSRRYPRNEGADTHAKH